ncbi:MAG: Hsp20/alpha crystallin family protein [Bacteroidetes bacterium]|nr:Hsp20/alpha crystallin family protein [Bacteroidota bacterium]
MTLVKFKRPNGIVNNPLMYPTPFNGVLENLFNENFFSKDFASFVPAVNIAEDEKTYHVELSAAGFNKEDISINLEKDTLTICGEHKTEDTEDAKNYSRKEFNYGSFKRSFVLPETVNTESISAAYENGILSISIPKKEEEKTKAVQQIKIS